MMRYRTVVADPPWDHSDGTGVKIDIGYVKTGRMEGPPVTTAPPYPVMSLDAIRALPVRELTASDSHLYLWVTNRYIRDVWSVAEGWGFKGVCILTWCKRSPGFLGGGAYPSNTEFCLFARRGSLKAKSRASGRWFLWPRRVGPPVKEGQHRNTMHSAKPDAFIDMVEQVSPGPYVELFSRRHRLGWDVWGNESANTSHLAIKATE